MMISNPLIEHYLALKEEVGEAVMLMQVGIFVQVLNQDARVLHELSGLKLKMAGDVDQPVVVGGSPRTGLDTYVGRLVRAGHSVAIATQDEHKARRVTEWVRIAATAPEQVA